MSVLFLLIAVSLVFASGFLIAFIWAMRDRQFEDDHTPAVRMLFENSVSGSQQISGSGGQRVSKSADQVLSASDGQESSEPIAGTPILRNKTESDSKTLPPSAENLIS